MLAYARIPPGYDASSALIVEKKRVAPARSAGEGQLAKRCSWPASRRREAREVSSSLRLYSSSRAGSSRDEPKSHIRERERERERREACWRSAGPNPRVLKRP